jgi:kynurenine formamidase
LANLDWLPPSRFTVACFPLRLIGAGGAPARVVAILDDDPDENRKAAEP